MSKSLKILLGAFGALALVVVVLNAMSIGPKLPLGPINGILAAEEELPADPVVTGVGISTGGGTSIEMCDPVTGAPIPSAGTTGTTPPGTTTPGATDPTTGAPLDSGTGAVDPATGAPADPAATTATDPTTGAPVAAPADGWSGDARVIAAGDGHDSSRVPDSWVSAEAAVDPATGAPVDPAAAGTTGATDPTTGAPVDPAAAGTTGTVDPATGATDPTTGAPIDSTATTTPGATSTAGVPCGSSAGAGGATGGTGAAGTTPGAAAGGAVNRSTTDGTNSGNNPDALRAAKDASSVMQKAKITVTTTATLVPATGGVGRPPQVKRYQRTVSGATLVMKLDQTAMEQWTSAGKKVQTELVLSFIARLGKTYKKAVRSVTVLDASGNVIAIGDASANGAKGRVKLY